VIGAGEWLRPVELIRAAPLELLTDAAWLEHRLLPALGLNDRHMDQYPLHLHPHCGTGLRSWQYPCQFAKYLTCIAGRGVSSYVEVGGHKGGTFIVTVEYLRRFGCASRALTVDPWARQDLRDYVDQTDGCEYVVARSDDPEFLRALESSDWDLALLDGDHDYRAVRADFERVRARARIVVLHDIVNHLTPGVQQVWREIEGELPDRPRHRFVEQYDDVLLRLRGAVMGIGVVELR
jgi:cephalosporin hydroxylase